LKIVVSVRATADLDRLRTFLAESDPQAAARAIAILVSSIQSLQDMPARGRPLGRIGLRELIVPFGRSGYVIRYHVSERRNAVVVLRIWHGRETRT
jgi:toxin ParE1/3/4